MSTEHKKQEGLFYSVIDGTFRRRVAENTPGATKREYETKDGGKAVKYEMVIDSLEGYVHDLGIYDGDFGRYLQVTLDPNERGINPKIQFSVETTYGEDVLKKLPHVDFSKPVKFRPYSFTPSGEEREVRGVEISQGDEKYKNFFWDAEAKKPQNGFPVPEGDTDRFTKDDWKMHFLSVRKFLIAYFTDTIMPKFNEERSKQPAHHEAPVESYPDDEIDPSEIPF